MDRVLRHSWFRSAGSLRIALPVLIVLLSVGGYLLTSRTVRDDRDAAASRRAQVETVRTQEVLGRARVYIAGLGTVLAGEPGPGQADFTRLASGTSASVGLVDVLWVQSVPNSERGRYERRLGAPITRLTPSGRFERAPPAGSYLPATYTTGALAELRPGVDVSGFRGLADAIRDRASVFAVSASRPGALGREPGFYLVQAAGYGRGRDSRGFLVAFVPRGWFTTTLGGDPRRVAISQNGRRIEGELDSAVTSATFDALGRRWRIDVGREPPSQLQSTLPWIALGWPLAVALIAFLVGRAIMLRRRAERNVERIFDLSGDLLCIAGLDGYFKRVNPSFERTLGYTSDELLARPFLDFVHPADRAGTVEVFDGLAQGRAAVRYTNRYICKDGSVRWLEWNTPPPEGNLLYSAARDVTDRRLAEGRLREAQAMVERSRDELRVLVDEQAALRRVATLVARGVRPDDIFGAVAEEVAGLLDADAAAVTRFEPEGTSLTIVATAGDVDALWPELQMEHHDYFATTAVWRTGRAARVDDDLWRGASGPVADTLRRLRIRSVAAGPIVVEGRLWGALVVSTGRQLFPPEAQERLTNFTDLVGTAIGNAESREKLAASRTRIVTAADEARRRIERDLHDGAQQRLVSLGLELRAAEAAAPPDDELRSQLAHTASGLASLLDELQEISRGIHPAILSQGGLAPALKTLTRRAAIPVELDVRADARLPERVEVAAYYVVSEALTNAAKHAHASVVQVDVHAEDSIVELAIRDDGVGGADPAKGSGLIGLSDRVEALGGWIQITSPAGRGTSLLVRIPTEP
jgi:PAS domain S-box-containing protein